MTTTDITYPYITENKNGVAIIEGTRMKITQIVAEKMATGWTAEELQYQHPEISLAQIYSALTYYADNEELVKRQIDKEMKFVDEMEKILPMSKFKERIKKEGLI